MYHVHCFYFHLLDKAKVLLSAHKYCLVLPHVFLILECYVAGNAS